MKNLSGIIQVTGLLFAGTVAFSVSLSKPMGLAKMTLATGSAASCIAAWIIATRKHEELEKQIMIEASLLLHQQAVAAI
jgi:hypothetical protein